jgi:hypothetical protein
VVLCTVCKLVSDGVCTVCKLVSDGVCTVCKLVSDGVCTVCKLVSDGVCSVWKLVSDGVWTGCKLVSDQSAVPFDVFKTLFLARQDTHRLLSSYPVGSWGRGGGGGALQYSTKTQYSHVRTTWNIRTKGRIRLPFRHSIDI